MNQRNKTNIYHIKGLSQEVIATGFAYISRSDKSFKDNLDFITGTQSAKFHEKWVLNYGHSSIAELANIQICCEKISRLSSSLIARSNPHISIIEYSQRYQKLNKDDYYIPIDIANNPKLLDKYKEAHNMIYDIYLKIIESLTIKAKKKFPDYKEYEINNYAFENARYILPISFYTSLAINSNARALRDSICYLISQPYEESIAIGNKIKNEALEITPTLLKYIKTKEFNNQLYNRKYINLEKNIKNTKINNFSIKSNLDENNAIINLISYCYLSYSKNTNQSIHSIKEYFNNNVEIAKDELKKIIINFSRHDQLPNFFNQVKYEVSIHISECCWHQLLRHRTILFSYSKHNIDSIYLPSHITEDEYLNKISLNGLKILEQLYNLIKQTNLNNLSHEYLVTNAHMKYITMSIGLKDFINLYYLRTTNHAQEEIRSITNKIYMNIIKIHPFISLFIKNK